VRFTVFDRRHDKGLSANGPLPDEKPVAKWQRPSGRIRQNELGYTASEDFEQAENRRV
jgi:hypothetical protein